MVVADVARCIFSYFVILSLITSTCLLESYATHLNFLKNYYKKKKKKKDVR